MSNPNGHEPMTASIEAPLAPPTPIEVSAPAPSSSETTFVEYGLKTPDGNIAWGSYLNRPIDTPEMRSVMVAVLRQTAAEIGWAEDAFLANYSWEGRHVHWTALGNVPITSEVAAPPLSEVPNA